jgi:U3 small nucleolar RNA-associated protein 21
MTLVITLFGFMFRLIISGFLQILVGSEEGSLQLWNTKTCSLIHEFKGWNSPVRCCTSSPALDIVAVGCANGKVYVHNLRYDETVVTFLHTGRGPVTALSFRTGKHHTAT